MGKTMLVSVMAGEESRIAILDEGNLDNLYIERANQAQIVGNVYKAKVVAVEQSLQAAFVDFGWDRQGFLHLSDIAPVYYHDRKAARQRDRAKGNISAALKRGQDILIQVTKEGIRNKAPAVTSFISLPGRYLVLMPQIKRHGISRKIADEEERQELRKVLEGLKPPKDMGIIVRTAAAHRGKREIHRDLNYLLRLWVGIQKEAKKQHAPALVYKESDLVIRIIRDVFSRDIEKIIVDDKDTYEKIVAFMRMTMPPSVSRQTVELYRDSRPLFSRYRVEDQIEKIHRNRVPLPGGGSIVIEQTEALVAIDVNSGRFKKESNADTNAYRINLQAAAEIGRQIRLRDLGGLIICDFIDMREEKYKREVERALWTQLKQDRARTRMLRMSRFGIIEMTRQRVRRNIEHAEYQTCPACKGTGQVRNPASVIRDLLRQVHEATATGAYKRIRIRLHPDTLVRFQNEKRLELAEIEKTWGGKILLEPGDGPIDKADVKCYKT